MTNAFAHFSFVKNSWTFLTFSSVVQVKISFFCGDMQTTWTKCTRTESIQYYLNLTTGHHQPVNTTELVTCHAKHKKGSQKSKPSQTKLKRTNTHCFTTKHEVHVYLFTHLLSLRSSSKNDVLPVIWFFWRLVLLEERRTQFTQVLHVILYSASLHVGTRMLITLMWHGI